MDLEGLLFTRANIDHVDEYLVIIHRCMNEVNFKDYAPHYYKWAINIEFIRRFLVR